ncbi:programmed cell death protein 2-like isoform X2 [Anabrus simplex]|uniref:programmed cell death protein 2-like isoform X2 n=1 Tax=Anabrus simplex TaxID=316456 RepID=UPI0034DDC9B7
MAQNRPKVLLGFEDETITDKHKSLVNFMTNKIGGKPDWYLDGIPSPCCQLCGLTLPLVLQVYAPLEASPYHRTLYLFGCINPNCWNERESWVCLRSQGLETNAEQEEVSSTTTNTISATDWCCDADDWGDEDNNINNNEENGNVIGCIESCCDEDDDDDETEEYEEAIRVNLGNLSVDECNANVEGGAVGRLHSPSATAEIEGDESGVVSIDTPTAPQRDLLMLLQEAAPVPTELRNKGLPQFASAFISVDEEEETPVPEHVRDLLQEYQQHSPQHEKREDLTLEKYEKSIPAHGDKMFHYFLTRIQKHPGQIIRLRQLCCRWWKEYHSLHSACG